MTYENINEEVRVFISVYIYIIMSFNNLFLQFDISCIQNLQNKY